MTIARAQMYRQLYQLGGIGTLPMDFGQPLQVPQQSQSMFTTTGSATSSPLLNYGQTSLGQAGGTSLSRLGYQEGGLSDFYKAEEPIIPRIENIGGLLDQAEKSIGEPQNNFMSPLATTFSRFGMQEGGMGIMGAMPQDSSMMQGGGTEQTALLTIIQLLIEQGVPPEKAEELAMQILQVFAQGGQPAVEEFANQLEQEEGMSENRTMMAGGGITNLYPRQGFFLKGVVKSIGKAVKGIGNAVKSIAKSPIGMIALSIAAPYAIGAMFPGFATLGGTGILGGALRAGISNLAIQGITTGKINPKQALLAAAAGGALSGVQGAMTGGINPDVGGIPDVYQPQSTLSSGLNTNLGQGFGPGAVRPGFETIDSGSYPIDVQVGKTLTSPPSTFGSDVGTGPTLQAGSIQPYTAPTIGDRFTQGIDYLKSTGTNLMADPVGTIERGLGSIYDTATQTIKDNPLLSVGGAFFAGQKFRDPLPGEDPNEYNKLKAAHDAKVAEYVTQYGGGANVYSPGQYGLYARENAVDPFAGRSSFAADGGQITNRQNYFFGSKVSAVATPQSGGGTGGSGFFGGLISKMIQQNPQMFKPQGMTSYEGRYRDLTNFIDENKNGIDDREEAAFGGRMGYAEGSIGFERKTLERKGYGDMMKNMTPKEISQLYDSVMGTFSRRFQAEGSMPMGEPRKNPAGIMELDYRAKGGFVPPIGIKEKADDIPAMLSNNEFVFTANAVRNAGGGDVDRGAKRMYSLMKTLESGGRV